MQLIRSNRPELGLPSNRLDNWLSQPFGGNRHWPALFDWDSMMENFISGTRLPADFFEDEDAYHVRMELPGVKKKEIHVDIENSVMTVRYEHRVKNGKDGESTETFSRSIAIPDGIVADKVSAKLKNGILHITLPKAEASKPRSIAVS